MDGTRTRDPRRDRPGRQVNAGAGLRPIRIPKTSNFEPLLARRVIALFQRLRRDKGTARCLANGLAPLAAIELTASWFVAKTSQPQSVNFPRTTGVFDFGWHAFQTCHVQLGPHKVPIDFSTATTSTTTRPHATVIARRQQSTAPRATGGADGTYKDRRRRVLTTSVARFEWPPPPVLRDIR